MTTPQSEDPGQGGFSLVEALVVLAVSSILLVVLTNALSQSRAQNLRLEDHFRLTGDAFYADLQLQALLSGLYIDPLLQPSGAQPSRSDRRLNIHTEQSWAALGSDVAFKGTSEGFDFFTQYYENGAPVSAEVRWIDTLEGRRLSLTLDGRNIVWPVLYDPQTRFSYLTQDGQVQNIFPPPMTRTQNSEAFTRSERQSPILVPKAIMAYREDTQKTVFIVDVP